MESDAKLKHGVVTSLMLLTISAYNLLNLLLEDAQDSEQDDEEYNEEDDEEPKGNETPRPAAGSFSPVAEMPEVFAPRRASVLERLREVEAEDEAEAEEDDSD